MPYPKSERGKKAATEAYKICSNHPSGSAAKEKCVMGVYNDKMNNNNSSNSSSKKKKG